MASSEGIVNEHVSQSGQRFPESLGGLSASLNGVPVGVLALAFLLNMEAQVLKKDNIPGLQVSTGLLDSFSDAIVQEGHGAAEERREGLRNRLKGQSGFLLAIRATKMAHQHNGGSLFSGENNPQIQHESPPSKTKTQLREKT
jgi:hypothetical protein